MAFLIIQDTFEPYYADRETVLRKREKPLSGKRPEPACEDRIILPTEVPAPPVPMRRDRRSLAH